MALGISKTVRIGEGEVSHKAFSEWGQVFGDEVLATAIRLLHHCEVISINGPSYRLKNRLKVIERETEVA